ncbi:DUF2157 domain-containing protein [Flavobacterium sp. JP2137]|uniref:DUF2157 domain-containing protein n=1 Tax=Flavobacterium sp. JP2137 TaxID=3414510 RepID=UPI003D2FA38A
MENNRTVYAQKLLEKKLLTANQFEQIEAYRSRKIFSVRTELKALLYGAVLLFTSGVGLLIYQNIDTIGHLSILGLLVVIAAVCLYFAFKNSAGFKRDETAFDNPVFDYLVLAGVSLSCVFVAYLQFQYNAFGSHYGLATIVPVLICFSCAYYFDNKSALSIGVTGLAAYVGLTVSPQALFQSEFYDDKTLSYSAVLLGVVLVLWSIYAAKVNLKKHFNLVYLTFALHLISLSLLSNLFQESGWWYIVPLVASSYFFYRASYQNASISLFVCTVLYAYIGFTGFVFRTLDYFDVFDDLFEGLLMVSPLYFIALIVWFIKLIKNFNKQLSDDRI